MCLSYAIDTSFELLTVSRQYMSSGLFTVVLEPSHWKCITGVKIGKMREGVIGFSPQTNLILLLGPWATVQNFYQNWITIAGVGAHTDRHMWFYY